MVRLDLGEERIRNTRHFGVWECGGYGFASGFIYGLFKKNDFQKHIEYSVVNGALAMTTLGDNCMVSIVKVEAVMEGNKGRTQR